MNNFAILDYSQLLIHDGIQILATTNAPCHLTLYWTDIPPRRHYTTRVFRGLNVPWQTYFCFVGWHAVAQNEAGDTLNHTFDLSPWAYCEMRYFTFRGTVAGVDSPSVGPIFTKHNFHRPVEYYYDTYSLPYPLVFPNYWLAQTFTPLKDHTIIAVRLPLSRGLHIGEVYVRITTTDIQGKPTSTILTENTIDGSTLPLDDGYAGTFINLPPTILSRGIKYAIVVHYEVNWLRWLYIFTEPYHRGQMVLSLNSGVDWELWPRDLLFEEWE